MSVDPLRALLRGCKPTKSTEGKNSSSIFGRQSSTDDVIKSSSFPQSLNISDSTTLKSNLAPELDFFRMSNPSSHPPSSSSTSLLLNKSHSTISKTTTTKITPDVNSLDDAFKSLIQTEELAIALQKLNLKTPTPIQRRAIPLIHSGHDVMAVAPTGSGKTLAYILPILDFHFKQKQSSIITTRDKNSQVHTVILVPTRELANQIERVVTRFSQCMKGRDNKIKLLPRVVALASKNARSTLVNNNNINHGEIVPDIVIATPQTLISVLQANDKGSFVLNHVKHVILDEADELLREEFVSQVDKILAACGFRSVHVEDDDEEQVVHEYENEDKDYDKGEGEDEHEHEYGHEHDSLDNSSKEKEAYDGKTEEFERTEKEKKKRRKKNTKSDNNKSVDEEGKNVLSSSTPRLHLFSATLPPVVQELAESLMHSPKRVVIQGGAYGGSAAVGEMAHFISQTFQFVGGRGEQGKVLAMRTMLRQGNGLLRAPVLCFVQSKDRAAQLFRELVYDGIHVDAIHGDRTAAARASAVSRFRAGKIWILIATDILARGLDFLHVNTVVNYDVPTSPAAYVHRIGRTGRNGRKGNAITLFTEEDKQIMPGIIKVAMATGATVPEWLAKLSMKGKKLQKDERERMEKKPPKRKSIGGPNRFSLKRGRKRKQDERENKEKDETEHHGGGETAENDAKTKGNNRKDNLETGKKKKKQKQRKDTNEDE